MPNPTEGLDPSKLDEVQRHALAILVQATPSDLAQLKTFLHLGVPAVVGATTLAAFVDLCRERAIDLTDAGVHAFKVAHHLDDTGANAGAIGPTTASVYCHLFLAATPPPPAPGRHITDRGLRVIENFEGYREVAYYDARGILTIGWGHTGGVRPGQVINKAQAEALLRADVHVAESGVERLVRVPINDNQFDALTSFVFNCGEGAFAGSSILRHLNAGDYRGAADAFLLWNKGEIRGQMVELPGLTSRRREERGLFLS